MISEQTKSEISGKYVGSPDQYAMYLRKSRADLEMEALGEGETLTVIKICWKPWQRSTTFP